MDSPLDKALSEYAMANFKFFRSFARLNSEKFNFSVPLKDFEKNIHNYEETAYQLIDALIVSDIGKEDSEVLAESIELTLKLARYSKQSLHLIKSFFNGSASQERVCAQKSIEKIWGFNEKILELELP
ncbi:MAG: hypothetical protein CL670_12485 [Balneola sp.]|jgi:hypothetical protein|nr:hypothetical protein [Balneola sp.]MBE79964.1 hypothetical protein [Balneola sp.]|tara:strand:+ start:6048 stop:6431 length:384 start_codon:yes stop_codon:yes gene_type:complete